MWRTCTPAKTSFASLHTHSHSIQADTLRNRKNRMITSCLQTAILNGLHTFDTHASCIQVPHTPNAYKSPTHKQQTQQEPDNPHTFTHRTHAPQRRPALQACTNILTQDACLHSQTGLAHTHSHSTSKHTPRQKDNSHERAHMFKQRTQYHCKHLDK